MDSIEAAQALQHHLDGLPARPRTGGRLTAVVVGSGFTGLEVASELVARLRALTCVDAHERPRVLLVDHHHRVAPTLGPGPHADIGRQLAAAGVELLLGESVAGFEGSVVTLASGTTVSARTVVWTVGMTAGSLAAQLPGSRDALGRLVVDDHLRLPDDPAVYLAGDVAAARADERHLVPQSCQYAIPLGRTAGWNAGADLLDLPSERVRFAPASYVTCPDLGTGEAIFTTGWDRRVQFVGQEAKGRKPRSWRRFCRRRTSRTRCSSRPTRPGPARASSSPDRGLGRSARHATFGATIAPVSSERRPACSHPPRLTLSRRARPPAISGSWVAPATDDETS